MYCGSHVLPLVIVDDLDIERVAFAELKANTPTVVDRHSPLLFPRALQFVQSNAPQRTANSKSITASIARLRNCGLRRFGQEPRPRHDLPSFPTRRNSPARICWTCEEAAIACVTVFQY